jgi:hypothetical protein
MHDRRTLTPRPRLRAPLRAGPFLLGIASIVACGPPEVSGSSVLSAEQGEAQHGLVILNPTSERPYFHDFGKVPYGQTVTHTYQIENRDPVAVTIEDLHPSCSCTAPRIEYTTESGEVIRGQLRGEPVLTLPPGAIARLKYEVDSHHVRYKNTDKLTMVVLRCDSKNMPFLRLEAHLFVEQAYQVTPEMIGLGDVPVSTGGRGKSDIITGVPGSGYRLLEVLEHSQGLDVRLAEELNAGGTLWQVQVTLAPPLKLGLWEGELQVSSTGPDGTGEGDPLIVAVRARVVPDVVPYPPVLGFLSPSQGSRPRAEGSLRALAPGHRIKIVDAEILGDVPEGLHISYEPDLPDAEGRSSRWQLVLEAPAGLERDLFTGTLRVMLEDPELDPIEIDFVYRKS